MCNVLSLVSATCLIGGFNLLRFLVVTVSVVEQLPSHVLFAAVTLRQDGSDIF